MPDREFIHSSADATSTLQFALDSGLQVIVNEPQPEPVPRILTAREISRTDRGSFYLFRPEWVFGPFQCMQITEGYNRGKYFVQRANFALLAISFHGERVDGGRRRLGCAVLSSYRDSLELPDKRIRPAPPDAELWFKRTVEHLSSGIVVKAGVHHYHICRGVVADPAAAECLPPFDFIPWGPQVVRAELEKKGKRKKAKPS